MKIISKFHDYYDSVLLYGADPNIRYVRVTKELPWDDKNIYYDSKHKWQSFILGTHLDYYTEKKNRIGETWPEQYYFYPCIIGFCGNMYKAVKTSGTKTDGKWKYYYTWDSVFKEHPLLISNTDRLFRATSLVDTFFSFEFESMYKNLFFEYKVPIFIIEGSYKADQVNLILNPSLKSYNFQIIKDPFAAFQEISQYISGVIPQQQPELVEVSNESMIEKKGFDKKWSFRKEPTKRIKIK